METEAFILSIFSTVCSILLTLASLRLNRKINYVNSEANFYDDIFYQVLKNEIPNARKKLQFTKNKLEKNNYIELTSTLTKLKKDIFCFHYKNPKFYIKLEKVIIDLDDFIISTSNKQYIEITEQSQVLKTIDKKIKLIYKCIFKSKVGKKF